VLAFQEEGGVSESMNKQPQLDPLLEQALKWLLAAINPHMHPFDRDRTIRLFQILKREGIPFSAHEVEWQLLKRERMDEDLARPIVEIASGVLADRQFRLADSKMKYWADDLVEQLRSAIQERTDLDEQ
jgi:tRNA A37 N6-isopentenylltransferase MiaA